MRAVAGFQRQGSFPTKERPLEQALALLEQRTADRFDALAQNGGDVVGDWIALDGLAFEPSKLGNGRLSGKWRRVGLNNAGFRLFLEVGTTTVISAFGFSLKPPPGSVFDASKALFPLSGNAFFSTTMCGTIAGVTNGAVVPALMTPDGTILLIGAAINTLIAADQVTFEVEIPIKKAP